MCELYPQWLQKIDLTGKYTDDPTNTTRSEKEIGTQVICNHDHKIGLSQKILFCLDCRKEISRLAFA